MNTDKPQEAKQTLAERLIVGAKVKIGKRYAQSSGMKEGEVITLVNGTFEYDNGMYTEHQTCPAIWNKQRGEYDSIYHLFENNLSGFMDCEILNLETSKSGNMEENISLAEKVTLAKFLMHRGLWGKDIETTIVSGVLSVSTILSAAASRLGEQAEGLEVQYEIFKKHLE